MAGTPGAAVIAELAPQPGDLIVPKRYHSAFTQTDLDATGLVHGIRPEGDVSP
jgi:nicotinamidase-related amidase